MWSQDKPRSAELQPPVDLKSFQQQAVESQIPNGKGSWVPVVTPLPSWLLVPPIWAPKAAPEHKSWPWDSAKAEFCSRWSFTCLRAFISELNEVSLPQQGTGAVGEEQ